MSTPQSQPSKGLRRSTRRQKHNTSAALSDGENVVSDSGPSPSPAKSVSNSTAEPPGPVNREQLKRARNTRKGSNAPKIDKASVHPAPSSAQHVPPQSRGTPIKKQAYAGPNFHSSPAPSALPIPSFYSKSMPSIPSSNTPDILEEEGGAEATEAVEESSTTQTETSRKRESTPLDFLFDAARQARGTPRGESPAVRSANISTVGNSPVNGSPAARECSESDFPFELEGHGANSQIGPAFATPYKERIHALRSASASPAATPPILDEEERKAKTDALKKLLMNAQSQRPATAVHLQPDACNPFNARAPDSRSTSLPINQLRQRSNPSTPGPQAHQNMSPQQHFLPGPNQPRYDLRNGASPVPRPASSNLRRQYHAQDDPIPGADFKAHDATPTLISKSRKPLEQADSAGKPYDDSDSNLSRAGRTPTHRTTRSTQQLEDDLRRVLKLDVTSKG